MKQFRNSKFEIRIASSTIFIVALALGLLTQPFPARTQQTGKVPRIGFLGATSESEYRAQFDAFRQGLRVLGYVEGKTLIIESRWAEGHYERLPALAVELVGLPVDLLVTHGTPGTRAAQRATATIPIVMANSGDAVATGLVVSLAQPGGNITGSTFFDPELTAKGLELLKEAVPPIRRVAVLVNSANPIKGPTLQAVVSTVRSLKLELHPFEARGPEEFENAFAAMAEQRVDALTIGQDGMFIGNARALAALAAKSRLPATAFKEFAQAGGLMAYGVNLPGQFRRAAVFVDKILKGAKPADLPVERATRFDLVINLKTAKALGLTIPQSLLLRANEVIE